VDSADASTLDTSRTSARPLVVRYVGLSIECHPDVRRLGETARLFDIGKPGCVVVHRTEPLFRDQAGRNPTPLGTARASRRPVTITVAGDGQVQIETSAELDVFVDGERIADLRALPPHMLQTGILLRLGSYLVLRLGIFEAQAESSSALPELVGRSTAMRALRAEIGRLADLDVPVLVRGETGVGKELVATALHRSSHRCEGPYVRVNLAAVPPPMAAGELFGHARGAFTGATSARDGYCVDAHGGTLFLDEIGATTHEVQGVLLRTIESGEIQPLGGALRSVSVRLIAATECDLESKVDQGTFSRALLQRFGYELWVPPLREHMEDVPILFAGFLGEELRAFGEESRLWGSDVDDNPYLHADFVLLLSRYRWPGNVRELRSVARRFAIHNRRRERTEVEERLKAMLSSAGLAESRELAAANAVPVEREPEPREPREPREPQPLKREALQLKDQDVLDALRRCAFEIDRTARELGVSRSWLHARMNSLSCVRKAKDLCAAEIQAALEQNDGDTERAAKQLEVSAKGLQLQITRLGLRNAGGTVRTDDD
jgi:two-component system nitrogen regulation response regulator GlnG